MWTLCLLFPLLVQGLSVIRNDLELDYNITDCNHCQEGTHSIQVFRGVAIGDCVIECALRGHCHAINYHSGSNLCELFSLAEGYYTQHGCTYIQRNDIYIRKSPCGRTGCDLGTICDRQTRTCVIKECMVLPSLTHGVFRGNLKAIGNRIQLNCDIHYKPLNGIIQSTCTGYGQWEPNVECVRDCGVIPTPIGAVVVSSSGTLQGAHTVYTCQSNYVHVAGSVDRMCQPDGSWNGTEIVCNAKICFPSGVCYVQYLTKDLGGHDYRLTRITGFEECSVYCEADRYKSIIYCPGISPDRNNCYCKSVTLSDGYYLTHLDICNFYDKL